MRLVLDTDVIVAAFRSETGASRWLVREALARRCVLLVSTALWLEDEAVLMREPQLKASRLTMGEVRDVLDYLANIAERVEMHFRWRPSVSDADDDHVVEAAINGQADALVTFNRRDFAEIVGKFHFRVWSPLEAMSNMR